MNVLRLFTYASILAVGLGASAIVACSSDSTATPAGDDDDDTDAGKSSSSSSSSSSGSSVQTPDGGPICEPHGTYVFAKPTYAATGGKVCDNYAAAGNVNGTGPTSTFVVNTADAGVDGVTYVLTNQGSNGQTVLLLAEDRCQLGGGEQPFGQNTVDANGNAIVAKLSPSDLFDFDVAAGTVKSTSIIQVDSDPTGAPGTPCTLTVTATGTKQ